MQSVKFLSGTCVVCPILEWLRPSFNVMVGPKKQFRERVPCQYLSAALQGWTAGMFWQIFTMTETPPQYVGSKTNQFRSVFVYKWLPYSFPLLVFIDFYSVLNYSLCVCTEPKFLCRRRTIKLKCGMKPTWVWSACVERYRKVQQVLSKEVHVKAGRRQ